MNGFLGAPTVEEERVHPVFDNESMAFVERDRVVVGRYTILERLGEGGFGVVYRARQNYPIRREVALKIVRLGTNMMLDRLRAIHRKAEVMMRVPGAQTCPTGRQ